MDDESASDSDGGKSAYTELCWTARRILTSAVTGDTVDLLVVTHLEETLVALTAGAIVATVPSTANAVAFFPSFDVGSYFDDLADNLVTGNARKRTESTALDKCVRVAHTTSLDLDEDLAFLRVLELEIPEDEWLTDLLEDGSLVRLRKR